MIFYDDNRVLYCYLMLVAAGYSMGNLKFASASLLLKEFNSPNVWSCQFRRSLKMFYTAVLKTWPKKYVLYIVGIFFFFFFCFLWHLGFLNLSQVSFSTVLQKRISCWLWETYLTFSTAGDATQQKNDVVLESLHVKQCVTEKVNCWKKTEQSANPAFFF